MSSRKIFSCSFHIVTITLCGVFFIFLALRWVGQSGDTKSWAEQFSQLKNTTMPTNYLNEGIKPQINSKSSNLISPGVVIATRGGLGNQLFRYACAYALSRRLKMPLYLPRLQKLPQPDKLDFKNVSFRGLGLPNNFNITYKSLFLDKVKLDSSNVKHVSELELLLNWENIDYANGKFLTSHSYCQSQEYFRDYETEILQLFQQNLDQEDKQNETFQKLMKQIASSCSVSIHIRRGDYFKEPLRLVPISFYVSAVKMLVQLFPKENLKFYIFSDSIEFVKQELGNVSLIETDKANFRFISDPNKLTSLQEFYLMRKCSHNIISDSSFSWWAAYLNENPKKLVIAPYYPQKAINNFEYGPKVTKLNRLIYSVLYYPREWLVLKYV